MAAPVDLELKKAFTELQAKVIDTQQKVKLADVQIEQLNRTKKHAHLTDTEIMTLVDETNMYEGVGRMFILQSKEAIHNQLLEKQKIAEEKIKELEDPDGVGGKLPEGLFYSVCHCPGFLAGSGFIRKADFILTHLPRRKNPIWSGV
ncbi:prefoldin subunit 1 isoform X2 [Cervus elaphus]|uniref:prefoldin subunit 1 isoform X2 n=1 Tax=Cervus canadensis TaxID=1574408 RepID=UPI001C9E870B|nr:prefoldin subunit 1 isoform X2 [Cervus canadensis]XP_043768890.1 prefoldin subunit 1 isoform X2 [Cervus elaphus]